MAELKFLSGKRRILLWMGPNCEFGLGEQKGEV